jgi:hypothetical protein
MYCALAAKVKVESGRKEDIASLLQDRFLDTSHEGAIRMIFISQLRL